MRDSKTLTGDAVYLTPLDAGVYGIALSRGGEEMDSFTVTGDADFALREASRYAWSCGAEYVYSDDGETVMFWSVETGRSRMGHRFARAGAPERE